MKNIVINAILSGARTTIDGGWRISFDLPEHEAEQVVALSKLKDEALVIVVQTTADVKTGLND